MGDLLHWKHRALEAEARLAAIAAAVEAAGGADAVRAIAAAMERGGFHPHVATVILRAAASVHRTAPPDGNCAACGSPVVVDQDTGVLRATAAVVGDAPAPAECPECDGSAFSDDTAPCGTCGRGGPIEADPAPAPAERQDPA